METKVCIIGAGPGGATAALQLAQLGIECIVVDKAVFPRDKVCGDGLSGKVLTLLERIDKGIGERLQQAMFKLDSWVLRL
jgi:flavin-dependent dehydrogenase